MATKIMPLSEAIRLGSLESEPCRCNIVDTQGRRCVHGAALLAIGKPNAANVIDIWETWPWTQKKVVHPANHDPSHAAWWVMSNLNDVWGWNREQIAEWVATVEPRNADFHEDPWKPMLEVNA